MFQMRKRSLIRQIPPLFKSKSGLFCAFPSLISVNKDVFKISPNLIHQTRNNSTKEGNISPMVQQYNQIKAENPDFMVLFQVGNFYEIFFDDAMKASKLLDIQLTRKGKKVNPKDEVPMCGFPCYALEEKFLMKLVYQHGIKVAICDQVEEPVFEGSQKNTLMKRKVSLLVTPGTYKDNPSLDRCDNNFLAAISISESSNNNIGLAYADISTREFNSFSTSVENLKSHLDRISPTEILIPDSFDSEINKKILDVLETYERSSLSNCVLTPRSSQSFSEKSTAQNLKKLTDPKCDVENIITFEELKAIGGLFSFIEYTHNDINLMSLQHCNEQKIMVIDSNARKSLELTKSASSNLKKGSLLDALDKTLTGPGSRLFARHLASPCMDIDEINNRLDGVEFFYHGFGKRVRKHLEYCADLEIILRRLSEKCRCTPKDLKDLSDSIFEIEKLCHSLFTKSEYCKDNIPTILLNERMKLMPSHALLLLAQNISDALYDDKNKLSNKGDFVREGYNLELDELKAILNIDMKDLEREYRESTGIKNLRIKDIQKFGIFAEVPNEKSSIMTDLKFVQFQSLSRDIRFRDKKLEKINSERNEAASKIEALENEIFDQLCGRVLNETTDIEKMTSAFALIDVLASHAKIAETRNFCRPVVDCSNDLHVKGGRHAIVESNQASIRDFVPNDITLDAGCGLFWYLTGSNMGGKSTFLRQNAQLVILAQIGSFVPADEARVGIVDKIFCRVGSSDDIVSDRSTFMVEMEETAPILRNATSKSLVIIDELGRGTSTEDGVAIARASLECLVDRGCRTLFASHFHQLGKNIYNNNRIQFYFMQAIKRKRADIVLTNKVVPGICDNSHGIEIAKIAGIPPDVTARAEEVVEQQANASTSIESILNEIKNFDIENTDAKTTKDFIKKLRLTVCNSMINR